MPLKELEPRYPISTASVTMTKHSFNFLSKNPLKLENMFQKSAYFLLKIQTRNYFHRKILFKSIEYRVCIEDLMYVLVNSDSFVCPN